MPDKNDPVKSDQAPARDQVPAPGRTPAQGEAPARDQADGETDREREAPRVDPRLDNRRGSQRPPLETWPAKPQHLDGPDVSDPVDREARPHQADDDRPRKGNRSPGPHGLGLGE